MRLNLVESMHEFYVLHEICFILINSWLGSIGRGQMLKAIDCEHQDPLLTQYYEARLSR